MDSAQVRDAISPPAHDGEYFARIRGWAGRSIEITRRLVFGIFPAAETTDAVDAWLAANGEAPAALRRLVIEQQDRPSGACGRRSRGPDGS